jgi:hypothetical protein
LGRRDRARKILKAYVNLTRSLNSLKKILRKHARVRHLGSRFTSGFGLTRTLHSHGPLVRRRGGAVLDRYTTATGGARGCTYDGHQNCQLLRRPSSAPCLSVCTTTALPTKPIADLATEIEAGRGGRVASRKNLAGTKQNRTDPAAGRPRARGRGSPRTASSACRTVPRARAPLPRGAASALRRETRIPLPPPRARGGDRACIGRSTVTTLHEEAQGRRRATAADPADTREGPATATRGRARVVRCRLLRSVDRPAVRPASEPVGPSEIAVAAR